LFFQPEQYFSLTKNQPTVFFSRLIIPAERPLKVLFMLIYCVTKILLNDCWLINSHKQGKHFVWMCCQRRKERKRSILRGKNLQPAPGIPSHVISRACSAEAISKRQYFIKKKISKRQYFVQKKKDEQKAITPCGRWKMFNLPELFLWNSWNWT
jgi:hypothetical protein